MVQISAWDSRSLDRIEKKPGKVGAEYRLAGVEQETQEDPRAYFLIAASLAGINSTCKLEVRMNL